MKPYTVKFAARATRQLTELYTYIADHSDEIRAGGFVDGIISCCRALETFPERGTKRDDIYPALQFLYRYAMTRNTFEPTTFLGAFYATDGEAQTHSVLAASHSISRI